MAGYDYLTGAVVVGRHDAESRFGGHVGADFLHRLCVHAYDGGHSAAAGGHRVLHVNAALAHYANSVAVVHGAARHERGILAEGKPRGHVSLYAETAHAFEYAHFGDEHCRLREFGLVDKIVFVEHYSAEIEVEQIGGVVHRLAALGESIVEILRHADVLRSLSGKYECCFLFHDYPPASGGYE